MLDWLEKRIGIKTLLNDPVVPKGWRLWLYFPGVLICLLCIWQAVTGLGMAFLYLQPQLIPAGSFLQGAHHWGADFIVLAAIFYFLGHLFGRTYKKPNELMWFSGILSGALLSMSVVSGYLLPASSYASSTWLLLAPLGDRISFFASPTPPTWFSHFCYILHIAAIPLLGALALALHWILLMGSRK
jgi:quinol-cytochrome oxidoreductase complex cytochrome b subunit